MADNNTTKRIKRQIRHNRVRSIISGSASRPRLSVYKANRHIYAQLIDDEAGKTLVSVSSMEIKKKDKKTAIASEVGKMLAQKALAAKVKEIVFDRGGFAYHGRVKSLAEGAREGGLVF